MAKVIKTELDYRSALEELEKLIDMDPAPSSPEADELEVLALLVEAYEKERVSIPLPDPVTAIEFRMEQQGLAPRDLVPFIGSRSKVSEVLSRKRPLTLSMVRALHEGLGIPAHVLIQNSQPDVGHGEVGDYDWSKYPIKEMLRRGWIDNTTDSVRHFFAHLPEPARHAVLCRKTEHIRSGRDMDAYALGAWTARIFSQANAIPNLPVYRKEAITRDVLNALVRESRNDSGPAAARDFLKERGIALIIEPHLPQTYLDGAAILIIRDRPVIGLTLRYDRLDNFWFTLMHELAHVILHSDEGEIEFIDDLDVGAGNDPREAEADAFAGEILVPEAEWKASVASRLRSPQAAEHLARRLGIHTAIVAGRMRHHWKAFRLLNNLVGHHEVRKHFDIDWKR